MSGESGRVLIVDDDAALRKVMSAYVTRLGFQVDACAGAAEALALDPVSYSLAVVDLSMPGIGGQELARRILERNPAIRVVLISGYPAEPGGETPWESERVSFLQKPFAPGDLMAAVARL